ncbi:MAG: TonB-dependent receptor [Paucibacter sp.]|nr:TonB-dependent receptor [Roseateles sp.]
MSLYCPYPRKAWITLLALAAASAGVHAQSQSPSQTPGQTVDLGTVGGSSGAGAASTASLRVETGTAAAVAPSQANLSATEPQSFISRAFIENSTPPTGNFNTILGIAPSISSMPATNGPGLSDQKMTLRGFQDGEYNVTFDGIPFGDTNGPTHHSTAYFPASVIGGMLIERGPGNASNIGYSTYGGSVNIFSKAPSEQQLMRVYGSVGRWNTVLEGVSYETGRMSNDATLQLNLQHMSSEGYLSQSGQVNRNFTAKLQAPAGDNFLVTLFASVSGVKTYTPDNASGPTMAQVAALGQNYNLNNNPASQGYKNFNYQDKQTDMEYVRFQGRFTSGWELDNNLYTYSYINNTVAGQDPSQYNGTADASLTFSDLLKKKHTLANGDVPGYFKLNEYRVWGDVLKTTRKFEAGLLRLGAWFEGSSTERRNIEADLTTLTVLPGASPAYPAGVVTSSNFDTQASHWAQVQPFVEFEWAAAPGLTVTPGFKTMNYHMGLESNLNQKALVPQHYEYTYHANLPYLTANQRLGAEDSIYAQYAKGMQVPFLGVGSATATPPAPQETTNYQLGWVHSAAGWTASADVYDIDMKNMQLNTGTNANPNYINAGGATYKGVELEATYVIGAGVSAYANYTINKAEYQSSNAAVGQPTGEVPNAPNMTSAFGLLFKQGGWDASLIFKRIGEQLSTKLGGQLPHIDNTDLNVAYSFEHLDFAWAKAARIQVSVFNLSNKQNIVAVTGPLSNPATQYQWQAPRSAMVSGRVDF